MTIISANKLDAYIQSLTSQISASVENIKSKQTQTPIADTSWQKAEESRAVANSGSFPISISYLEPKVISSIQHFVQESNTDKMHENSSRREQVAEEENSASDKSEKTSAAAASDFADTLDSLFSAQKQEEVSKTSLIYGNKMPQSEVPLGVITEGIRADYVASAYDYVFNIDNQPLIKIEFMHKYNRSFDYTI